MNTELTESLKNRVLIIDGAMGTMIQRHKPTEEDYRGEQFKDWDMPIKGNNDILSITQPAMIQSIHLEYLEAGADIVETNTFSGTTIAQADYGMEAFVYDINYSSAQNARKAIETFYDKYPDRKEKKYVAGAIGPTNKTLSLSPDVNDPGFRAVTFDDVANAYYEQIKALHEGGVDILLIETIFDTLNCKAAIYAVKKYFNDLNIPELPIMISGTITDASGRTLSGQTLEAFYISVEHAQPLSVGLNCALGAAEMRPHVMELSQIANCFVSAYPNAGLPNAMGEYDELPEETAAFIEDWAREGFVNIVGGCCGTTPDHIRAMAQRVKGIIPRQKPIAENFL